MNKVNCILLIDDNQTSIFLHQKLLQKLDLSDNILVAHNGQQALELMEQYYQATQECPALILLDLKMPVMNGFEFFAVFQQLAPAKQSAMKVVVLTTSLANVDRQRAQQAGMVHYMNKPLTAQKLKDIWPTSTYKPLWEKEE